MSNYPWGPHGPSYDGPPQTTPNPTAPTPVDNSSYTPVGMPAPSNPYPGSYSGGYSGGGPMATPGQAAQILASSAKGDFLLNLIAVGLVWPVWVCLYPLPVVAGYFTLLFGAGLAIRFVPSDAPINPNLIASAIGALAALVVLWNVSRFEQQFLSRLNAYRIPRHVVRLVLIAVLAVLAIERSQGIPISYTEPQRNFAHVLSDPKNLAIVLGAMLASHFILWNWKWARDFWNNRLTAAQLRKRGT